MRGLRGDTVYAQTLAGTEARPKDQYRRVKMSDGEWAEGYDSGYDSGYLDGQESMMEEIKDLEKQVSNLEDQLAELVKG
jgi:flagellar biosynthesis/type III secretory pathway protein FliH